MVPVCHLVSIVLKLHLQLLMDEDGAEKLRRMLEAHENRMRAALDRVREDLA